MAFSWQEESGVAGQKTVDLSLNYLDKADIHLYLNQVELSGFTWDSDRVIRFPSTVTVKQGDEILIIRKTNRERLRLLFSEGAAFTRDNLDEQNTQFLFWAQEFVEGRSIDGFYGDIDMHGFNIKNLGNPEDPRDATNKQYVDALVQAEAAIRAAADAALDARTTTLEQTYLNANTNSFPWWTITTAPTTTITPGVPFTKAKLRLNGVTQTAGYSYTVKDGVVTLADEIPAGTLVDLTIGIDTEADTSAVSTILGLLGSSAGAGYIGTEYGVNVATALELGRIVYPEMFSGGRADPSGDELFSTMFAWLQSQEDTQLSQDIPYTVDLRGKVYTLKQRHTLDINVNLRNGTLLMDGGSLLFGNEAAGSRTRRHTFQDLKVRYVGTSYFPDALIKVARAYNTFVLNCDFWAGVSMERETSGAYAGKPKRARHGLWLGSKRVWGSSVIGGEYWGGEIPCRIGYTNDHTGITVAGGGTFHHGFVGNLLMCNPAGSLVAGVNIEHSEDGAWGLGITSGTNADLGVVNAAHGVDIIGVYFYNNGNGSSGTNLAPSAVLIGTDMPGTEGFDKDGVITSQNTAHSITVRNSYIVSPKQARAVVMRGLSGLVVENCKYSYASGESFGFRFEGTAAASACLFNRNQGTGSFDEVEYTSTNIPRMRERSGSFTPQLRGATTAGSMTYSTRGGDYAIIGGRCDLSLWLTVGEIQTAPAGALTIELPVAVAPGRRSGSYFSHLNLKGSLPLDVPVTLQATVNVTGALDSDADATLTASGPVEGTASGQVQVPIKMLAGDCRIISGTTLALRVAGSVLDGSAIGVGSDIALSISYPVAGATYTGS